jgi:hypothetical protein
MIIPSFLFQMLSVSHPTLGSNGMIGNSKLDFSYFLNPPPIYEELPDHSDRNNGPSEDEFAEDELSVIDIPINHDGSDPNGVLQARYQHQLRNGGSGTTGRNQSAKQRAQSLTRKRSSRGNGNSGSSGGGSNNGSIFKSQRSLDRRSRNNIIHGGGNGSGGMTLGGGGKYNGVATNPRGYSSKHNTMGMDDDNNMLILSNPSNGMTMKIPPHLVAVLTESCNNGGARPYDVIPTSMGMSGGPGGGHVMTNGGVLVNPNTGVMMTPNGATGGIYQSSRSSGSSYGDGGSSSNSSARNNPSGNSIESSSFDSGIGPHSITSKHI